VGRGDTLQSIAFKEYDDAGEWRRIAEANGIDDPLELAPGKRLLIPPILD
jgi:nucleoid-associated protein YgaU